MQPDLGIPLSWWTIALVAVVEILLVTVWKLGRLGLRVAASCMGFLALAAAFWVRPDLLGIFVPLPSASLGAYRLWDALFLMVVLIATAVWFRLLKNERHLVALTREMALNGALPELDAWAQAPKTAPRVAIVIPAKDEQEALPAVLASIRRNSPTADTRVLVVDDGSSDRTGQLARQAGAITLRHPHALGIGGALTTGFLASLQTGADVVIQMDADGQHDAAALTALTAPILSGQTDWVIATRQADGAFAGLGLTRRVGIRFYSWFVSRLSGYELTDLTSGFRAVRVNRLATMLFVSERNWAIEMTVRAGRAKVPMIEVRVPGLPRVGGHSQFHDISTFFLYHVRAIAQVYRAVYLPNGFSVPCTKDSVVLASPRTERTVTPGHPNVAASASKPPAVKSGHTAHPEVNS